jgi:hypothetical protein
MQIEHSFFLRAGAARISVVDFTATIEADPYDKNNWVVAKIVADPWLDRVIARKAQTVEPVEITDDHYLYEPALADFLKLQTAYIDYLWAAHRAKQLSNPIPNFGGPVPPAPVPEAPPPLEQTPQSAEALVPRLEPVAATEQAYA